MGSIAAFVIGVIALAGAASAQEAAYSDEAIEVAIDVGARDKVRDIAPTCLASPGMLSAFASGFGQNGAAQSFDVTGLSPLARVATIALQAQERYMPAPQPGDDQIAEVLSDDIFVVNVAPDSSGDMWTAARLADTGIDHVVIRPRGDKEGRETVQPLAVDVSGSATVSNLYGASVELVSVMATFDRAAVIDIAERADVEVLVIAGGREFKCNLDDTRILRGYRLGS